jgi:hypothetical protein
MLRTIKQFITGDAKRLSSQLSDLENNVATETADIRTNYVQKAPQTARISKGGGVYTTGQTLIADTSAAVFSINLAAPRDGQPGWLYVIIEAGPSLTIRPVPPAKINALTVGTIAQVVAPLYFDGSNWWL